MNTLSAESAKREVKTGHHTYIVETLKDGHTLLSGHPQYCPKAVKVDLMRPLQPGSPLWFLHPVYGLVRTSRIKEIRELCRTAGRRVATAPDCN